MRIAQKTLFDNMTRDLSRTATEMFRANQTVSSGKRIERLSDDPVGLVSVLDLNSSLANINQLERNINTGRSWLNMAEASLSQAEDLVSQTKALCVDMASATRGADERANASTLVEGYLQQIVSLANAQISGRYIFSGTCTDISPFVYDDSEPPGVSYQGNESPFSVKIGRNLDVTVGQDGEAIFGDIFGSFLDLKTALQENDLGGIQGAMDKLDGHLDTLGATISNIGAKTIQLDARETIIQELNLTYTERKSKLEDVDLAEAILKLKSRELAYQAALSSSSKVMSMSLLDYL